VVGTLAIAGLAAAHGTGTVVGGLTWERRPIDPLPGPRLLGELRDAEPLGPAVALAGPRTTGPGGFRFAEARVAELLGEPTVLVDPNPGPAAVAAGVATAARHFGCDVVVLLDVGGDVLAHGDEPGLASPLADAVLLAATPHLEAAGLRVVGAVFGAGCDGELTPAEVAERLREVDAAGGGLGALELDTATRELVAAAVETVPTEASAMALRCATGETGRAAIREGRRSVELTAAGGTVAFYEPGVALATASRLAAAVQDAPDLLAADAVLAGMGVRTELGYERRAGDAAAPSADGTA
jgi:hypothetical protein